MSSTSSGGTWVGVGVILLLIVGAAAYFSTKGPVNNPAQAVATTTSSDNVASATTDISSLGNKAPSAPAVTTDRDPIVNETSAALGGSVMPNGSYTSYWYEYGTTTNLGLKSPAQDIGSGYQKLSAPGYIRSLAKNTTYYYRLVAKNEIGSAIGTTYDFKTAPGTAPVVGGLPKAITTAVTNLTTGSATLNGEVNPNKVATDYWFEYGSTKSLGNTTHIGSAGDGGSVITVAAALSGLTEGTSYYYRVNAQNRFGTINGLTVTFKTKGTPAKAPDVKTSDADNVASTSATLSGTVNPHGLETAYWFEYSTDSALGSILLKTTDQLFISTGTSSVPVHVSVTDLATSTTYYYRIVAQNNLGTMYGSKVNFTTK